MENGWYVLQTQRHREQVARGFLQRHYETYLPLVREQPPPVVGNSIAPMFPCYLFVRATLPEAYYRIARTPGVKDFLRNATEPGTVPDQVIEFLRSKEGSDGVVDCATTLQPGAAVEISHGAFEGLEAVVEQYLPRSERVRVLLAMFQRQSRVEVPASWVRELRP